MPKKGCIKGISIPTGKEYETTFLGDNNDAFFKIRYKDMVKAGFCERRLKVHEIISDLQNEGWIDYEYPLLQLQKDYDELIASNYKRYLFTPNRLIGMGPFRGRKLIEHFFPIGDYQIGSRNSLRKEWVITRPMFLAINSLLSKKRDITRGALVKELQSNERISSGPKSVNPDFWRALLSRFAPNIESIVDVDPGLGAKLLAAACAGVKYRFENAEYGPNLLEMADFLGLESGEGNSLCILSDIFPLDAKTACDRLSKYLGKCNNAVILLAGEAVEEVERKFPPKRKNFFSQHIWKIYTKLKQDFIFYY